MLLRGEADEDVAEAIIRAASRTVVIIEMAPWQLWLTPTEEMGLLAFLPGPDPSLGMGA